MERKRHVKNVHFMVEEQPTRTLFRRDDDLDIKQNIMLTENKEYSLYLGVSSMRKCEIRKFSIEKCRKKITDFEINSHFVQEFTWIQPILTYQIRLQSTPVLQIVRTHTIVRDNNP